MTTVLESVYLFMKLINTREKITKKVLITYS